MTQKAQHVCCSVADGNDANADAYLIFVTDTTDGVCVKKNCPV